jgi:hypothetical protein
VDHPDGYNFVGINSASAAQDEGRYTNTRSELWFRTAAAAKEGSLDTSRLPPAIRLELGRQLMAPRYSLDHAARLKVEAKDQTKDRLSRSPDDADAFNLAYYVALSGRSWQSGKVAG